MGVVAWLLAAVCAGLLGWLGRPVMALLPASPDAADASPTPLEISRAPHLSGWLAAGAVGLVTVVTAALPADLLPAWVLVCGVGAWLAYIDFHTKVLPTRIIRPLFVATLLAVALEAWAAGDHRILVRGIAAAALAYGAFWLFWWIGNAFGKQAFGFGDVRFSAPLGLALGTISPWAAPVGLYLGFIVGAVLGLALKALGRADAFAFGPAMLIGAVIGAVVCA